MTIMPDPRLPPFSKEQLEDYIERVEGRYKGTSNSTFRYSAENPPKREVFYRMGVEMEKLIADLATVTYKPLPGEHRDLSPTEGKRLCPAREEEWQECESYRPDWNSDKVTCVYCGGKMKSTYFDEYDDD